MGRTALCFGSESVPGDDIAFRIFGALDGRIPGVRMVKCGSSVEMMYHIREGDIYIIDAVRGLEKPRLFKGLKDFRKVKSATVHDLDLGSFLRVLKETGKIRKVKVIGVPPGYDGKKAVSEVRKMLSS